MGATGVTLFIGDSATGISLTNGGTLFVINDGMAGTVGGTVELLVPGADITLAGDLLVRFNTTGNVIEKPSKW